jgi:hypothetical protein
MPITLPVGSVLYIDTSSNDTPSWTKLTEHNRDSVSIDNNRIEKQQRMANGTLRKVFIADKKTISTSWRMLPSYSTMTIDNGYGAVDLKTFYLNKGTGSFKVKISYNAVSGRDEILNVVFTQCSHTLVKRNVKEKASDAAQEFWDMSISLEEV